MYYITGQANPREEGAERPLWQGLGYRKSLEAARAAAMEEWLNLRKAGWSGVTVQIRHLVTEEVVEAYPRIIVLKCESDKPSYDQSLRPIFLEKEDEMYWWGRHVGHPTVEPSQWPKFAWKIMQEET